MVVGVVAAAGARGAEAATQPAFTVGHVDDAKLDELSGFVPSRKYPGVYWGHNDSDNPAEIWALNREGHVIGKVPVVGAPNVDWEDIALDEEGNLYISDMGNNNCNRKEVHVYKFKGEPDLKGGAIRPVARWAIRYVGGKAFDCESLVVRGGWGYVMPKLRSYRSPELYRFRVVPTDKPVTLEAVGGVTAVHGPVTGADISVDGKWMAVLTVLGPYVLEIDGDPANAVKVKAATGHSAFVAIKMEAVCFVPEGVLAGTEEGEIYLFDWKMLGMGGR
jgi:hypothetical protein